MTLQQTPQKTSPSKFMPKIGGPVAEDRRMTKESFNLLVQQMEPIQGNLCPQKGKMHDPFNAQMMPDLSCPGSIFGGKYIKNKTNRRKKRTNKTNRRKKRTNKTFK